MSGKLANLLLVSIVCTGVLRASPSPLMGDYMSAWGLSGQGRFEEASGMIKSIIERDRTFWRAYRLLVDASNQWNQIKRAEQELRALCDADPGNAYCWYGLGRAAVLRRAWDEASGYLVKCIEREPGALPCYQEYVTAAVGGRTGSGVPTADQAASGLPASRIELLLPIVEGGVHVQRRELDLAEKAVVRGLQLAKEVDNEEIMAAYSQMLSGV